MRFTLLALVVALGLAACSQVDRDPPDAPAAPPEVNEQPPGESQPPEAALAPPPVVLESEAGRQVGVRGGYCVTNAESGQGLCVDAMRPEAAQASIVRPGEIVTIVLEGARAVKAEGCHSRDTSCIGEIRVSPAGCKAKSALAARVFLERGSEMPWRVDLRPGLYELQLFFYFDSDDGRTGDGSAALGLLVDPSAEQEIVPMPAAAAVCP
jgi:hypothetical protein